MPFSIETNMGGQKPAVASHGYSPQPYAPRTAMRQKAPAPQTATRKSVPAPRTGAKAKIKTSANEPTPAKPQVAVEEKVVEGSLKVIEDRVVEPSETQTAKRPTRTAPSNAKRRVRATRTSLEREPTT